MRLLLDQLYAPAIAVQLRHREHDVESVLERRELIGLPDPDLFAAAQTGKQTVVTENVPDFMALHLEYAAAGRQHRGLIFTSDAKFPRGSRRTVGALVKALDALLRHPPAPEPGGAWVHWL